MDKIIKIFRIPDIRKKVFYVLGILVVFRVVTAIPVPSIDTASLSDFFAQNQLFGLLSIFTGGGLSNLSIGMLGLGPYITGSIIMQLLTMVFPKFEQMYKYEGEAGRTRFNQYSRMLTIPLAALQAYGYLAIFIRQGVVSPLTPVQWATSVSVAVAGAIFLMWLGELITEKNIGNGISLLIFAGIIARFPQGISQLALSYSRAQVFTYLGFAVIALIVIAGVVYLTEAQRNIPINYAKRVRGFRMYGGVSTYLPMRVNNAGVMPIIFALSILLFPSVIANFFSGTNVTFISNIAKFFNEIVQDPAIYSVLYFILVVAFTYFYTAVTFDPKSISDNIQKQGGYIPGIRPGQPTAGFLSYLLSRITLIGAIFLGIIAILPNIVQGFTGITAFTVGGTSILIVVSVALEVMKQLDSQISMYEY